MEAINFLAENWQQSLKNAITDPHELLSLLELPNEHLAAAERAVRLFPLRVPREFVSRMRKADLHDPLLMQVLPIDAEFNEVPGYTSDPLQEANAQPLPGLVHKYSDRVLLILSGACAINCRYCFRRHFPYADNQLGGDSWQQVLDYIGRHTELREVIFSGGDPLVTSDSRLQRMIEQLEQIPHLQRLRIHTRLPVVIPSRINASLCSMLQNTRLKPVMVLHINHPQEIDAAVTAACTRIRAAGITLLNQAVLLKGVNDCSQIQTELARQLFTAGILPYYLFLFDPVAGASHFDIDEAEGIRIAGEMQRQLPGYLMPRLAREIPGRDHKTLVLPDGNFYG